MKYLVFGAAGQLGRDLCPRLKGEVIAVGRAEADLGTPGSVTGVVLAQRPDVVINCAAYNFVDRAETEPAVAFAVNALGLRELALACRDADCALVHFSTDYVFGLDEYRRTPYEVGDAPGPVSAYGLSKLAGEYSVRSVCPRHFVIRTCGLYGVWGSGGKGGNFVETMLRLAGQGKPLRVVADQVCTPSYTRDVAAASLGLIEAERYGLYHITNSGTCSWYELAKTAIELAGLKGEVTPITSKEYGAPARRPSYSVLSMVAYESLGLLALRPWREAVAAYLDERKGRATAQRLPS